MTARTLSTEEVLDLLGISRTHLRVSMLQTPRTIDRPWACYGGTLDQATLGVSSLDDARVVMGFDS